MVNNELIVDVAAYINTHVIQSHVWDNADHKLRTKAVNRAVTMLTQILFAGQNVDPLPVELIAEQAVWLLKIDDSIERAEMGMKNIWVDGTMLTITEKDNSICPTVYKLLGIPVTKNGKPRKVGSYHTHAGDIYRWGNKLNSDYYLRKRRAGY